MLGHMIIDIYFRRAGLKALLTVRYIGLRGHIDLVRNRRFEGASVLPGVRRRRKAGSRITRVKALSVQRQLAIRAFEDILKPDAGIYPVGTGAYGCRAAEVGTCRIGYRNAVCRRGEAGTVGTCRHSAIDGSKRGQA